MKLQSAINGDGKGDVIIAGYGAYGGVYLGRYLLGQSDGTFLDKTAYLGMPEDSCPIYYGDLTGDPFGSAPRRQATALINTLHLNTTFENYANNLPQDLLLPNR